MAEFLWRPGSLVEAGVASNPAEARRTLEASSGVPVAVVNTSPVSTQFVAAMCLGFVWIAIWARSGLVVRFLRFTV